MNIAYETVFCLNFFNYKTPFFGSFRELRYKIECSKEERENAADGTKTVEKFLDATVWKGPCSFEATTEEKQKKRFPFSEEGRCQVIDWLNEISEQALFQ